NYNRRAQALSESQDGVEDEHEVVIPQPAVIKKRLQKYYLAFRGVIARERADIRARVVKAELYGDETGLRAIEQTKRQLKKLLVEESAANLLKEIISPILLDHNEKAGEIEELNILRDAHRMMLIADDVDLTEA